MHLGTKKKSRWPWLAVPILLAMPAGTAALWAGLRTGDAPKIEIVSALPAIGPRTLISVRVEERRRGLVGFEVELVQGSAVTRLDAKSFIVPPSWNLWAQKTESATVAMVVGKSVQPLLKAGEATIRVRAQRAGTWLKHPDPEVASLVLPVRFQPPMIAVMSRNTFVAQGGSEAVVYRVSENAKKDGVRAGLWWFPGFPLPGGGPLDRFSLFAAPYDHDTDQDIRLVVADELGNEAKIEFIDQFKPRPFKTDTIGVTDKLMNAVVPAISGQTPSFRDRGSLLANYVAINSDLRRENNAYLETLAERSAEKFLWTKPFIPMQAKVISSFADRRSYVYEGKEVDRQDHLGLDLASTQKAPIPASNDGVILLAEYFGIYGNAVVIDHGYGLMTLYGHLSTIDVKVGQDVKRGETIGRTGTTGLALGDHLHFTMLLQGLPVTPIEWWDDHWIRDRLVLKLGAVLPLEK